MTEIEKPDILEMQFNLRLEIDLSCKLEYELLKYFYIKFILC